jgi:hypothetical protein
MIPEQHPDPFEDVLRQGVQRAIQLASGAVTAAQVYLFHRNTQARAVDERDDRARRALQAQMRAEQQAGRTGWAPALDPAWLREADLFQVARAWSAAMPYSDRAVPWYEPAASTAMRKCEERLRELHPYAMARYDRLRTDGLAPAEAMQEAAPLFARPPRAHGSSSTPRPMVTAGDGLDVERAEAGAGPWTGRPGDVPNAGLVNAEQDRATAAERVRAADLDAATDRTATPRMDERAVNLIAAQDAAAAAGAAAARARRAGDPGRPWERDFPIPIHDVLAMVSRGAHAVAPRTAASSAVVQRVGRTRSPRQ